MQFYEKLVFLMQLTNTSNKVLAQELQVDPSLVSLLRTARRGIPRNRGHVRAIARFMARRCAVEYRRAALAQVIGGVNWALLETPDQVARVLYHWLCDEPEEIGQFMRTIDHLDIHPADGAGAVGERLRKRSNTAYYGSRGKLAATRAFAQQLRDDEAPGTLFIASDNAIDWYSDEQDAIFDFCAEITDYLSRGGKLVQIVPPNEAALDTFAAFAQWLPLFITGQVEAYYYPRMRDQVYRRNLCVLQNKAVVVSTTVGASRESYMTLVTLDPGMVHAYDVEFQDYLRLCLPLLTPRVSQQEQVDCMGRFVAGAGNRVQRVASLSTETTPRGLIRATLSGGPHGELANPFLRAVDAFEHNVAEHSFVDIVCLATAQQVRDGEAPILLSYYQDQPPVCYTPETYVVHLKNILRLMEVYENYHFVPVPLNEENRFTILVQEDHQVILLRLTPSVSIFELNGQAATRLCAEYLCRQADRTGYAGSFREKNAARIRALIRELETPPA